MEHSFLKQIKDAKLKDIDKAGLCCFLVYNEDIKAILSEKDIQYLLGLIHLEWRGFKEVIR